MSFLHRLEFHPRPQPYTTQSKGRGQVGFAFIDFKFSNQPCWRTPRAPSRGGVRHGNQKTGRRPGGQSLGCNCSPLQLLLDIHGLFSSATLSNSFQKQAESLQRKCTIHMLAGPGLASKGLPPAVHRVLQNGRQAIQWTVWPRFFCPAPLFRA